MLSLSRSLALWRMGPQSALTQTLAPTLASAQGLTQVQRRRLGSRSIDDLAFSDLDLADSLHGEDDGDLSEFMHGRRGKERSDSVTELMLEDRRMHRERMLVHANPGPNVLEAVKRLKLGGKRRLSGTYTKVVSMCAPMCINVHKCA